MAAAVVTPTEAPVPARPGGIADTGLRRRATGFIASAQLFMSRRAEVFDGGE